MGGLLHAMLPTPGRAAREAFAPARYVDTGFAALLEACEALGASRQRLVVRASGAAYSGQDLRADHFRIGSQNVETLRRVLWTAGLSAAPMAIGGTSYRTMRLYLDSGELLVVGESERRSL